MKVPEKLASAFGTEFEDSIAHFAVKKGLLPEVASIQSPRFLARSIVPHVVKLSALFNRDKKDQGSGLGPYWKGSSNPAHLRLAYFLYFMPSNLYRVGAIWSELSRLGYRWPEKGFRAVEFGAGPASGACGIAAGEQFASVGLPKVGNWALIEQDKATLELGADWAHAYFSHLGFGNWDIRTFQHKIDENQAFLPRGAPKFNLWLMSYYLNETTVSPNQLARTLIRDWTLHLEEEGLVILVEPALKHQSRRLLELRRELLLERERKKANWLQILLPCLGHQICGALNNPEDWCHEDVTWWRPPYYRKIDKMAGLDRKTLPFTYLVLAKSLRSREEILPELAPDLTSTHHRLVSPAHQEGRDLEFFLCGTEGKVRTRYRPENKSDPTSQLQRGDILLDAKIRGDKNSSRITQIKKIT